MKITFYEVHPWEQDYLSAHFQDDELTFSPDRVEDATFESDSPLDCLSVFIYSRITHAVLARLPKLKLIATRSTGYDHIDLDTCRRRGIGISNVPSYGENTVAEHTFALILSLARNVHKSYRHAIEGRMDLAQLTGFDLQGKTLGVVGAGRIGLHVIKIARGFGMRVLVFDVRQDDFLSELLSFKYAPLEQILEECDILTLHAPHNDHTHHLLNRERFGKLKKGALLINTSRGGLVETEALIEALDSGQLGGAGLDVLEGEELLHEEHEMLHSPRATEALQALVHRSTLLKKDNVVYTPHNAFNSREALERILQTTIENVRAWKKGQELNRVQ